MSLRTRCSLGLSKGEMTCDLLCAFQIEELMNALEKTRQELDATKARLASTQQSLAEKEAHLANLRIERRKQLEEILEMKWVPIFAPLVLCHHTLMVGKGSGWKQEEKPRENGWFFEVLLTFFWFISSAAHCEPFPTSLMLRLYTSLGVGRSVFCEWHCIHRSVAEVRGSRGWGLVKHRVNLNAACSLWELCRGAMTWLISIFSPLQCLVCTGFHSAKETELGLGRLIKWRLDFPFPSHTPWFRWKGTSKEKELVPYYPPLVNRVGLVLRSSPFPGPATHPPTPTQLLLSFTNEIDHHRGK